MRRHPAIVALGLVVAATSFLVSACTPAPSTPTTPVDYTACPTAGAGQVQVAVVVQGGQISSPPVVCVVVPAGSTGLDALNARAQRIGRVAPRLGFGGAFVCAVDGLPAAPACSESTPDGFAYWNYWNALGDGTWQSSDIGAGDRVVTQGSVDAWVFGTWDFTTTFPEPPTVSGSFATLTH